MDAAQRAEDILRMVTGVDPHPEFDGEILCNIEREIDAAVAEARRAERASIADWFQEAFCPRSGVPGDERHARGDCDYCNMAAAIRRPASAPESTK